MRGLSSLVVAALGAVSLTGCAHTHLERNAPGHIDVETPAKAPPPGTPPRTPERPRDPGERFFVLSPGLFAGGGPSFNAPGVSSNYAVGPELTLLLGESKNSHHDDDFVVYPRSSFGLNAGVNLLSSDKTGPSTVYAELQYNESILGGAAGWAWDPQRHLHGPQFTLFAMPLYLRSTTLLGDHTDMQIGLMLKFPTSWVWSK